MLQKLARLLKKESRKEPKEEVAKEEVNKEGADEEEVATRSYNDKYSTYPSNGLTPERLARIFREADQGEVMRQMELFEEMEEKDPHLFSQLQTRKNAVTGTDYEIIAFSDDEYDKQVCEFVKEQIEGLESFEDVCMDLLDAIGKGVSFTEIIWDTKDGKSVVKELKHKHAKRFFWDDEDLIRVTRDDAPMGVHLPKDKFIIHRYKAKSGHPSRAGVLRVVAWMYLFKNYDIKDWVSFCEVYGMPLRLGKYDPSASEEDKAALMNALFQLGTDAAGITPSNTEIEFKESAKTTSINVYESLARFCDEQMSKAVLGQTLTSDSGGSYAQSKTHNSVRQDLVVADCKALAATLRRDLIRPLVLFNFAEATRIPYIRFDCEEADDLEKAASIYETLITSIGLPVSQKHLYMKFSIPQPERGEDIVSPVSRDSSLLEFKEDTRFISHSAQAVDGDVYQTQVDELTDKAIDLSTGMFKEMFNPLLKELEKASSLEELKELLEDDEKVAELYKEMDSKEFEELLLKSMFYADMLGRSIEYDRD